MYIIMYTITLWYITTLPLHIWVCCITPRSIGSAIWISAEVASILYCVIWEILCICVSISIPSLTGASWCSDTSLTDIFPSPLRKLTIWNWYVNNRYCYMTNVDYQEWTTSTEVIKPDQFRECEIDCKK